MTAQESAQQLLDKIVPQLSELGFEAFVLAAYHRTHDDGGNEVIARQVIVNGGNNVPMQDGLRPMVIMGARWKDGAL